MLPDFKLFAIRLLYVIYVIFKTQFVLSFSMPSPFRPLSRRMVNQPPPAVF